MTTREETTVDDAPRFTARDRIAADMRPVQPLRRPCVRATALLPFALLLLAWLPLVRFHVRSDIDRLPVLASWGASLLQIALGFGLAVAACRQVVPGQWASARRTTGWLVGGVSGVCLVMAATWGLSAVRMPPGFWLEGVRACFRQSFAHGLPLLAVGVVLTARGLPDKPAVAGALVGLSAGVAADAAWRMVCVVTEPSHVLTGHLGAVLGLALAGSALLSAWNWLQRLRG